MSAGLAIRRDRLFSAMLSVLALLFSLPFLPAAAAPANPAEAFVQQNVNKGYGILNNSALSEMQRQTEFRNFLLSLTDTRRIGLFTLGPYANRASKADIDAFLNAFTDYAVAVYESRLTRYKGQTLRVTGSMERAPDDVVVNAEVVDPSAPPGAQPFRAAFRVRKGANGRPIITDMQVEGIWLALSQRSDFTGYLQQHGGSVAALTEHLRMQTAQIRNNRPV